MKYFICIILVIFGLLVELAGICGTFNLFGCSNPGGAELNILNGIMFLFTAYLVIKL